MRVQANRGRIGPQSLFTLDEGGSEKTSQCERASVSGFLVLPNLEAAFFSEVSMALRHLGLCMALFAFFCSVPAQPEPAFAAASEQTVEFRKGVPCVVRVVAEGEEAASGPWRLDIALPDGKTTTFSLPLEGHSIYVEEIRAASFITQGKQELFIAFTQIHNGVYSRAYVIDFANGAASILFDSDWLHPGFEASGLFRDQYRMDIGFPNLSDRYRLTLEGEKKALYEGAYDARTARLREPREIFGSYPTRCSVLDPQGKGGLHSLEVALFVAGALRFDPLGEYLLRLRQQGGKWHLQGDTQFIPETGIASVRVQGPVPVAAMNVAVTARGLEMPPSAPGAQGAAVSDISAFEAQITKLAARGGWNPAPRQATALGTNHATYAKVVKDILARNGLPDATPQIMQLFRVDLEGDGVDEVVLVAQNILGPETAAVTWLAEDLSARMSAVPERAKKGDYSLVLVRKLVGGKVREIPLYQFIARKDSGPGDAGWVPPLLHKVHGFADVNGDGVMEILLAERSCETFSYQAYTIKGESAMKIPLPGAGSSPSDGSGLISAGQARTLLQKWLNGHPLPPRPAILARKHEEYTHGGEAYYLFSLDDRERYWLNFLVHKKTGQLLYMMISDGEHASVEIEPLDAWYAKHH